MKPWPTISTTLRSSKFCPGRRVQFVSVGNGDLDHDAILGFQGPARFGGKAVDRFGAGIVGQVPQFVGNSMFLAGQGEDVRGKLASPADYHNGEKTC